MKHKFTITMDKSFYGKLKEIATAQNRTLSNLIEYIVREYLADK